MRKQCYQAALGNCYGLKLPAECSLRFKKKNYRAIYYNFRRTFVPCANVLSVVVLCCCDCCTYGSVVNDA